MKGRPRLAGRLAIAVPALALAGAYVAQYGFALYPCEMCWWQRWPHFAALALALLATQMKARRPLIAMAAVAIGVSGAIGLFHAGVEYKWWEGITGCAMIETGAEGSALDNILAIPLVRCDEAAFRFLSISMAGWNGILSLASALWIGALLMKGRAK